MKKQEEPGKTPKKESEKKTKKKAVNDIIQKIVDAHATADQALAEMSYVCKEKCEGK
jgi:hypothetical protein